MKRGPREERKGSRRDPKAEKEAKIDKEPKERKMDKNEEKGEKKDKVLPPAPKSNPWKKVATAEPTVPIKESDPKVSLFTFNINKWMSRVSTFTGGGGGGRDK